jgi:N-acetylglucosamine kinase-like BadF-type ATPase
MASCLIVDSGSTKTDWCYLDKGNKPVYIKTSGINPYLQKPEDISSMLVREIPIHEPAKAVDSINYFGAGAASKEKKAELKAILSAHFEVDKVEVDSDLMAAARALCGETKGIVSILGTGSSSCYYDGKKIAEQQPSLGYLAGDEGSGNYIGKRILQYYAYGTFDDELKVGFEMRFGSDIRAIINNLYHSPYPNRYLASFVPLLHENRGHYMVENIIEDCINEFFHHSLLKYRQSWKKPLYFSGSVAYGFKDVIESLCHQYELELGLVVKSPMEGLVKYYSDHL